VKKLLKWAGIIIGVFIVIGIIASLGGNGEEAKNIEETKEETVVEEIAEETKAEEVVEEVVQEPEPIILSGKSQQASDKFTLQKGLSIFKMTHDGSSNFAITLLDENGQRVALLVNEIGSFDGSKAERIKIEGTYVLDISADGNWVITIEQPRPSTAPEITSFSGKTQEVTQLFSLSKGLKTFKMKHSGDGNFAPILLDKDGNRIELLANEIGVFDGSKAVGIASSGIYVLDVSADGNWELVIE